MLLQYLIKAFFHYFKLFYYSFEKCAHKVTMRNIFVFFFFFFLLKQHMSSQNNPERKKHYLE